jgi:hypothetical protein
VIISTWYKSNKGLVASHGPPMVDNSLSTKSDEIRIYDAGMYDELGSFKTSWTNTANSTFLYLEGDHLVHISGSAVVVWNLDLIVELSRFVRQFVAS